MAKIAIVHYRAGRTDGVSLEIAKRKQVAMRLGHEVRIISGPVSRDSDYIIPDLEFDTPEIRTIKERSFKWFGVSSVDSSKLMASIEEVSGRIEQGLRAIYEADPFDVLLVHNVFSHGRHIAAASSFARFCEETRIPVLATHHDYFFDRPEYAEPSCPEVQGYLDRYVPPDLDSIWHVSINSLARTELLERRGIDSMVLGDFFDFDQPAWARDDYNSDMLDAMDLHPDDLVILQATRIVRRKGIELAIDFVRELDRRKGALVGQTFYNGKTITRDSRVVLLLAGYAEESAKDYLDDLRTEIRKLGIESRFASDVIDATRRPGNPKIYSLWDAYACADIVTYPSLSEGWGNQFIEAVFAKKPIVLFEYPVYVADIASEGYSVISLGREATGRGTSGLVAVDNERLSHAAGEAIGLLVNRSTVELLENNWEIGRKHHSYAQLERILTRFLPPSGSDSPDLPV